MSSEPSAAWPRTHCPAEPPQRVLAVTHPPVLYSARLAAPPGATRQSIASRAHRRTPGRHRVKLRLLTRADVQEAVSMAEAIEAVKAAFAQLSSGRACVPLRTQLFVPQHNAVTLVMPAYLAETGSMAIKVVSVFPKNPDLGLPTTQGVLLVVDPETGSPVAIIDATYLTALRTGAASGAATDLLARRDARHVAILGAGNQGRTQLLGVCEVRKIERVWVYDQFPDRTQQYVADMKKAGGKVPARHRGSQHVPRGRGGCGHHLHRQHIQVATLPGR